jgi:hypothetical protein
MEKSHAQMFFAKNSLTAAHRTTSSMDFKLNFLRRRTQQIVQQHRSQIKNFHPGNSAAQAQMWNILVARCTLLRRIFLDCGVKWEIMGENGKLRAPCYRFPETFTWVSIAAVRTRREESHCLQSGVSDRNTVRFT